MQLRLIGTLKCWHASGRACQGVMHVLDPHQLTGRNGRVLTKHATKSCFHLPILPLHLTVGLGVKSRGQAKRKTCWQMSSAVSFPEGILGMGTKWAILLNQSITVRMALRWRGSLVTKSREMWDYGRWGRGRGCRRPAGNWWKGLFWWHTGQALTNSLVALFNESRRQLWMRSQRKFPPPPLLNSIVANRSCDPMMFMFWPDHIVTVRYRPRCSTTDSNCSFNQVCFFFCQHRQTV